MEIAEAPSTTAPNTDFEPGSGPYLDITSGEVVDTPATVNVALTHETVARYD